MHDLFKDKTILVTGGAGSIGKRIIYNLLPSKPAAIRSFDHNEYAQFQLSQELKGHDTMRFLIGDVRDAERVRRAVEGVDYVFHASALKHVPLCEYNPFEAVQTNILGTQHVLDAAFREEVQVVINVSTDKAVNPVAAMGATKLLAERLTSSTYYSSGRHRTRCASVRFGNVINSNGSVIPTFLEQIRKGGPVTVTDPRMTRFMMSSDQAVNLIFEALELTRGGEIFILKMPVIRIMDLAEELIALYQNGSGRAIQIEQVGIRPGEKLEEELMTPEEAREVVELPHMFILPPRRMIDSMPMYKSEYTFNYPGAKRTGLQPYRSGEQTPLTRPQIRQLMLDDGYAAAVHA
jgi:UDP-N-acetylglucosamine 4,6-dehydratase